MAAINQLITRDLVARELIKRKNWAQREVGVVVVLCIVFVVGSGLISLFVYKQMQKRKANKPSN